MQDGALAKTTVTAGHGGDFGAHGELLRFDAAIRWGQLALTARWIGRKFPDRCNRFDRTCAGSALLGISAGFALWVLMVAVSGPHIVQPATRFALANGARRDVMTSGLGKPVGCSRCLWEGV